MYIVRADMREEFVMFSADIALSVVLMLAENIFRNINKSSESSILEHGVGTLVV
jgi:hypothetical protein